MTRRTEQINISISTAMADRLDTMMQRGGYGSRAQLCRSLLLEIINDDARAHDEPTLKETA